MRVRPIWILLILALVLRLIVGLSQDHDIRYQEGSNDSGWYLTHAYTLITGQYRGDMVVDVSHLSSPPLFFIFAGIPQAFLPVPAAVVVIRIVQALMSTAICYFAYRLARLITRNERISLLALAVMAVSPAFLFEAAQVTTETLYMFLLTAGIWLYVENLARGENSTRTGLILAAVCFGAAALTRAVILAFPLGLAVYWIIVYRRRGIGRALMFIAVYAAVVLSWTAYSVVRWNRFVIAGEGLPAFLYIGATGWVDPYQLDERLLSELEGTSEATPETMPSPESTPLPEATPVSPTQQNYIDGANISISANPLGYIRYRVSELVGSYLQPHGITLFAGESLREIALDWLREDRSLSGLIALTFGDAFWIKLAFYIFHFAALFFGLIGMWRTRRQIRLTMPLLGFIAYTTAIHLVLYALPRYVFPSMVFWVVFAAAAFMPRLKGEPAIKSKPQLM